MRSEVVTVVYFNQWFSSIGQVMNDLKEEFGGRIKIIASSKTKEHVYKKNADLFVEETWENSEDTATRHQNYLNWVLDMCNKYEVNVFFVKNFAKVIMKNEELFTSLGVKLIYDKYETIEKLDKKSETYETIKNNPKLSKYVPDYRMFKTCEEMVDYLKTRKNMCVKLNSDEGGQSFRLIKNEDKLFSDIVTQQKLSVSLDELINIFKDNEEKLNKMIFMGLLESPEISVDCYNSKKGFIAICRDKTRGTRVESIYYNKKIASICEELCKVFDFKYPFNVQFRYTFGNSGLMEELRLLEINTRISGGLYMESKIGLNIAEVCLKDVIGDSEFDYDISDFINFDTKKVTHIEECVVLQ